MTNAEWIERELTQEERSFDRFARQVKRRVNGRVVNSLTYSAFVICDATLLDELIPEQANWSMAPAGELNEDGEPILRQKTLREFLFPESIKDLGDGTVCFQLRAMEATAYRNKGLVAADMVDWDGYLSLYNHSADVWFGIDDPRYDEIYKQDTEI